MVKIHFEDGFNQRLEMLQQLARTIVGEIDEIVSAQNNAQAIEEIPSFEISLDEQIKRFEINLIRFALFKAGGKQIQAAKMLKIKPTTLNSRIKRYRISSRDPLFKKR